MVSLVVTPPLPIAPITIGIFVLVAVIVLIVLYCLKKPLEEIEDVVETEIQKEELIPLFAGNFPSAPPVGEYLRLNEKRSVKTERHPFIITEEGGSYMPSSDWWSMAQTIEACLGFELGEYAFLTENGIYYLSPLGSVRLCENKTPKNVPFISVHIFTDTLYALGVDGCIYKLVSKAEFSHYHRPHSRIGSIVDLSNFSKTWFWEGMDSFYGFQVRDRFCNKIEIVETDTLKSLYLTVDGAVYRYRSGRWRGVDHSSRGGYRVTVSRGLVSLLYKNTVVKTKRGRAGYCSGRDETLYVLNGISLYRVSPETNNLPIELEGGSWVKLITLENGTLVGISDKWVLCL